MAIDTDQLLFDGDVHGYPTTHDPIVRDDKDVLVYCNRRRNSNSEWEIRGYRVLGNSISFTVGDVDRAELGAILASVFDPDELTTDKAMYNQTPISEGVPVVVAMDSVAAIATWLYVAHSCSRDEIADTMVVDNRTVDTYLSRFRSRGIGLPDDIDIPDPGEIMDEIPLEMDYSVVGVVQ